MPISERELPNIPSTELPILKPTLHPNEMIAPILISYPIMDLCTHDELTIPSHINTLPAELVLEIFAYCVDNEGVAPLKLRQVSRWWQEVVDTSPLLWQTLVLDDLDGNILTERQAEIWARKSQPLKYELRLKIQDPEYILPLLSPFLSFVHRWRSFRFIGNREEDILEDLDLSPDTLTHLHLCLHDYDQDDLEDDDGAKITFSPISPGDTSSHALNLWIAALPSPRLLPRLRFVHVTIAEGGHHGIHTQPRCILGFLTACPDLESFFLSGCPHDNELSGDHPVVNLPNLITLHLKSTCFVRILLSSLNTPRLENLFLSHLNVDFELLGEFDSEGDSDDEAQDYSQSPSSDQATGMGLRKLIKRCSPPIRILEMDFCDMRTKDFRYVFDKLPLLENFHIVASDMSNKVLDFLRPIYSTNNDTPAYVRLPHLRKLRLTNCQRLSGMAITEAISARVEWTDAETPEYTLVDVDIAGCASFTHWDRMALIECIGDRLRPG